MRDEPGLIDGVTVEPAADVVVETATGHLLQGNCHHSHGLAAGFGIHALDGGGAQEEAQIGGAGEFGCAAKAAVGGVEGFGVVMEGLFKGFAAGVVQVRNRARFAAAAFVVFGERGDHAVGFGDEFFRLVSPCRGDGGEDRGKAGTALAILGGEISAAVERLEVGGEPGRERPAAPPCHRLNVGHVHLIDVGALLAVDLDGDEVGVEQRGDGGVFKRFVGHDVAPVAGGVADAQEDRFLLGACAGKSGLTPRQPVHGVVGVLPC